MIHYKDKSFCIKSDICTNYECDRKLSERDKTVIKELDLLVAWSDCSTIECDKFIQEEKQ